MTKKIGIVGSGTIGQGWMILFAKAGYEVHVFDAAEGAVDMAFEHARASLRELERLGQIDSATIPFSLFAKAESIRDAVQDCVYAQENVTEDAGIKSQVFSEMDIHAPASVPLGSSCSSIPPSLFLEQVSGRERCIVAHPFNPPHLIPIVEVVPTVWNSQSIIDQTFAVMKDIGQTPVLINKEIPGFVVNRLQAAVVNEAVHLVEVGAISPEDLDRCMRSGLGLRWALMGPFETMDLNAPGGFMDYATKFGHAYQKMGAELKVDAPWRPEALRKIEMWRRSETAVEQLPARQAWRDEFLVRLRALVEQ